MKKEDFLGLNITNLITLQCVLALLLAGKLEWYYAVPIMIYLSDIKLTKR